MKKEFLPYYLSRAVLSAVLAIAILEFTWQALLATLFFFGLFLLYLHSGWFKIDLTHPLFPIRRDQRAESVQRKALITALVIGLLSYLVLPQLSALIGVSFFSANLAIPLAVISYFLVQFVLLSRA